MTTVPIPPWAKELQELFCSGTVSQFVLYGNIYDLIPSGAGPGARFLSLNRFLEEVMLDAYDAVIYYDRGRGTRVGKGARDWSEWLSSLRPGAAAGADAVNTLAPAGALAVIDRFILRALNLQALKGAQAAYKLAVVLDFAQFIVPRGDPVQFAGELGSNVIKVLSWANDPAIARSAVVTFLITEKIHDLNTLIVENSRAARIEIKLPDERELCDYLGYLASAEFPQLGAQSGMPVETMAKLLIGVSRIEVRNMITMALNNGHPITAKLIAAHKKEVIEEECRDLLEFYESPFTLDFVAGHEAAKNWLRQDSLLIKKGALHALPMGYLITGRVGTGKTFLVQCWAGELGIPCVVLKNFRDKWVGATEGNLEKIFSILHALGRVVVFVDEADQMTGRRESGASDSGVSGRVYAMIAKEMSDTRNRGKILWVFATSRPDLLELDLKRQGRLDVHIPLFPPQTEREYRQLFLAAAKKLKLPLGEEDVPPLPEGVDFGGHEVEGMIVRAMRIRELEPGPARPLREIFKELIREMKPSAYTKKLDYMDMAAVRECTDASFLPERFSRLSPEEVERKLEELKRFV